MMIDPIATRSLAKASFMSANFLARERGYRDTTLSFGAGSASIAEVFAPAATYADRISELFEAIAGLGFGSVDLWTAHCNPKWATPQHIKGLKSASQQHGVEVVSLAGGMGGDLAAFEEICQLSNDLECPLLGVGGALIPEHLDAVAAILDRHQVSLGFENHPNEKTPADVLEKIGHGNYPRIGATLDTGWFATHSYPVLDAIDELKDHLFLVHLKNIEQPGEHKAAEWNQGCLNFEPIVRRLKEVGYGGYISLEYEPVDHDPSESCRAARQQVEEWLHSDEHQPL